MISTPRGTKFIFHLNVCSLFEIIYRTGNYTTIGLYFKNMFETCVPNFKTSTKIYLSLINFKR